MKDRALEETGIFAERCLHFFNLWTIYTDMLSKYYVPSVESTRPQGSPSLTMMLVLYAYFFSLVEDSIEGLNAFRLWRQTFPEESEAITAVERQVAPFNVRLRQFRNRLGFHGSTTRQHENLGLELFAEHSGTEIWSAMRNFKSLAAALFAKTNHRQGIGHDTEADIRAWIDSVAQRARDETMASNA